MPPRVLIALPHEQTFARALLSGIGQYVTAHNPWSFHVPGLRGWPRTPDYGVEAFRGDGMIVQITNARQERLARDSGIPFVNLTARTGCPTVANDNVAIGQLAATHFRDRGFRRWAFFDVDGTIFARQRADAFVGAVRSWGMECSVCNAGRQPSENHEETVAVARAFLETLAFPVAVFAATDVRARALLDAATALSLHVPRDVAILGVDNEVFCEFTSPTLSTVLPDGQRVGFQAAAMLARLMRGERLECETELVPPRGLIARASTNTLAVDDPVLAQAVEMIRAGAHRPLDVTEILSHVPASRRTLERRFREALGHGPGEEIRKAQLDHVRRLLVETDWPIERVARASAFRTLANLGRVFRVELGISPGEYRNRHRAVS